MSFKIEEEENVVCLCKCNEPSILLIVKKEGPNKGRGFYKCASKFNDCGFFKWSSEAGYGKKTFKIGTCFRCGRYGCETSSCSHLTDFYGNIIS